MPLRQQVENGIRSAIQQGRLAAGSRLPSTRAFAADSGVARGLVVEAYAQLVAEGYLTTRRGAGTHVAHGVPATRPIEISKPSGAGGSLTPSGSRLRYDFRPGVPDLAAFPRAAWLRATRDGLARLPDAGLSYGDSRGLSELRAALAEYLARVRGVAVDPRFVLVTNGVAQALALLAAVLVRRAPGGRPVRIGVEDPSGPGQRLLLEAAGVVVHPVTTDGEGIDIRALPSDLAAVLVTPAHQFPTGVVMSPGRRTELANWARRTGALLIEDDYDAEYRFDREPSGALQGLAPEHIVYTGSVSKGLAPALRLGWAVVPPHLLDELLKAKATHDLSSPVLGQAALASMLTSRVLERHLRKTRRMYRDRRDALGSALSRYLPGVILAGVPAGLHAVARLPSGLDETAVAGAAAALSVGVYPMAPYRVRPEAFPGPALVLGYAPLSVTEIVEGIRLLAVVIR